MPPIIAFHTVAALTALVLGIAILLRPKGTATHKLTGRIWVAAMAITAITSFWIQELRHGDGFSPIHILSIITLASLARAIYAIRHGNVKAHQRAMIGAFAGVLIAGAFTLLPGRIIGGWIFGG
ncbi:MAG: DUF2306 domain-containing protein [Proteobacteria bacterium]|nr:DUF2306 domain-containing protein [Pseudomonadota bacterium]